jgi:hypothetical protein
MNHNALSVAEHKLTDLYYTRNAIKELNNINYTNEDDLVRMFNNSHADVLRWTDLKNKAPDNNQANLLRTTNIQQAIIENTAWLNTIDSALQFAYNQRANLSLLQNIEKNIKIVQTELKDIQMIESFRSLEIWRI